jgi:hypothetical protein
VKICKLCGLEKPLAEFDILKGRIYTRRNSRRVSKGHKPKTFYMARCIDCRKSSRGPRSEATKLKARAYNLQKRFGITIAQYEDMFAKQQGLCAICLKPSKRIRLAVDHCHATGRIRGLLCKKCNYNLLPLVKDDALLLQRAADYLKT